MKKSLFIIMLMAMFAPLAMNAQESLPYSYGFENNDLEDAGWTSTSGSINSAGYHTGSYGFRFSYNVSSDVFLVSPVLLGGTNGVNVSFYYKAYSSSYLDHFYVGYTTDENATDPSRFTYGNMITSSTSWQEYTESLPAGTVRVAIKYDADNYDDGYYLYLDDFSFTAMSSCATPTDLTVDYTEGETTATVTWRSEARSFNIDINGTVEEITDNPYTLRAIEPATTYTIKVQAVCDEEPSDWASTSFFSGCPDSFRIPYAYGFEDAGQIECWTISAASSDTYTGVQNNDFSQNNMGYDAARTGDNFFFFLYTQTPPSYLISPELSGIQNGLHVEFYYRQYESGEETFHVGYSTTNNNPDSFTWGDEMTASSSYQRFSANYPAETKYVAVKLTSNYQYYLFLDDFLFEESASCLEPTGVAVADVTTTGANVSWTAGGEETAWDIYVTDNYEDVPDETTTPTVAGTSDNPYALTGLTPATIYYVYVRAICGEEEASAWSSPATFNTECESMTLPYSEDFAEGMSVCWSTINGNTSYHSINVMPLSDELNALAFYRGTSTGDLIAVLPEVDETYPLSGYQISFYACYANSSSGTMTSGALSIGVMSDPNDASTFEEVEALTIADAYSNFGSYNVRLNTYTGTGRYLAIKNTHTAAGYVLVAEIEVTELPSCLEPTNLAVAGGMNAVVTWEGEAESFDVALATSEVEEPADYIVGNTEGNELDLSSYTSVGMNYVYVRANCGTNGYSEWVGISFDVNYCAPNITSHDSKGITGVAFGTGDDVVNHSDENGIPSAAPYYGDYSSMIGAVQAGVESTIAITTNTGNYPYTFVIWVDLDNSLSFEDSEVLYVGKATSGSGTLNATITIPATQELGDYRMRIYGADSYFTSFYGNGTTNWDADHDPCADGTWRHACDFTVRVLEAPSCLAAADVTVKKENITSTSAVISWTNNNGEEATYTVMQGENVLTTTAVDSYTLEGLTSATSYPAGTYTIISSCDETVVANVPAFATLCDDITTLPWSEDFEGFDNNTLPGCWDNSASTSLSAGTTQDYYIWGVYNYNENNMIRMNNWYAKTGTALINSPVIDLPAEGTYQLSFDYAHNASCGSFYVKVSKDNGATWTDLESYIKGDGTSYSDPGTFTHASISLADYAGETIILQFFANANYGNGAIFVDNVEVAEAVEVLTITKDIVGYGENAGGYYLIASPVVEDVNPEQAGMITEEYDLYSFNQVGDQEGKQWFNYKANNFDLVHGRGYLYASESDTQITFTGTPYEGTEFDVELSYSDVENFAGYNLVGNPFNGIAFLADGRDFYTMNDGGTAIVAATSSSIEAMEGIFVIAEPNDAVLTFTTTAPDNGRMALALNLTNNRNLIDRAIVRFDSERQLPKFQLFENSAKLYIAQGTKDYAVVASEGIGEMPVNFEAASNGTYTLSLSTENVTFSYLHLIDNMTGADIDLLANPSYTFDANTSDYASRFKLVFATSNSSDSSEFAFVSDGNVIVNGEGTLQIIDMMGRVVRTEQINGMSSIKLDAAAGVYVLQLNDKTQKIVIK